MIGGSLPILFEHRDLLAAILQELRTARTIPSTGIALRQRAVEQGVDYILSEPRMTGVHVSMNNAATLGAALLSVQLQSSYYVDYSLVLCAAVLSTIPLLALFVLTGRQLVAGIMPGAVKG